MPTFNSEIAGYHVRSLRTIHYPQVIVRDILDPFIIEDIYVSTDDVCEAAVDIRLPHADSWLNPTVYVKRLHIRAPNAQIGLRVTNGWNAVLEDVNVTGGAEMTTAQLREATMRIGIDLGNSMDANLVRPHVTYARTGVRVYDSNMGGEGEGCHIFDGWLMHVGTAVDFQGFGSGGWPTPNGWVQNMHLCFTEFGVKATRYCGLHVSNNDFYASQFADQPWGVYCADSCGDLIFSDNRFWDNRPPGDFYGGYVLDGCDIVDIRGGIMNPCVGLGAWVTANSRRVRLNCEWNGNTVVDSSRP